MNNMQQKLVTRPGVYIHIYVLTEGRLSARIQEFSSIYAPTPGEFARKTSINPDCTSGSSQTPIDDDRAGCISFQPLCWIKPASSCTT